MGTYHRVRLRDSAGDFLASVRRGDDVACGESPRSGAWDRPSPSGVAASWPCGYCRIESTAVVGDLCPCCGHNKALPWWRMTIPGKAVAHRGVRRAAGPGVV